MNRISWILLIILSFSCSKDYEDAPTETPKKWIVTTIAGNGSKGSTNGDALSASFHFPEDVAVLTNGDLFVTDVLNFNIRKIAGGQVSTFAGGKGSDIINGDAVNAQFKNPYSITTGINQSLFTTDENDPRIRKIAADGTVSTFAGVAERGFIDGKADTAKFGNGNSIVADADGNIFVADAGNNCIRKVSADGWVTTIAGTGIGGFKEGDAKSAQFALPGGISIDKDGNLYVVDRGNFRIRKISAAGQVSTVAGNGEKGFKDGHAHEAQFGLDLHDIVVDPKGNLYVEDENRIRKISTDHEVTTIAGSVAGYEDGDGLTAKFNFLSGITIDAQGNLYVTDLLNNRIRKISLE